MAGRKLTVVEGGGSPAKAPAKKAPAKKAASRKPRTIEHAAKLSKRTLLETVRNRIAAAMDDPRAHPRDVMAGAKQLLDVQAQIDALSNKGGSAGGADDGPSAVVRTPNADWDEDAI